jgi:hypothetical protein
MDSIGGYFGWEFPVTRNSDLHDGSVYLNSGRHSLEYILCGIGNVRRLWIPYFTCDVVLEPLSRLGILSEFYHIDENLEIACSIDLQEGEYLLYTNYYGIKDAYVREVVKKYGERVIIDNAQALYCTAVAQHQFYSPRKFMGMPDGGFAVTSLNDYSAGLPQECSFDRCLHLLKRIDMPPIEGYGDFKANSKKIGAAPLSRMSNLSRRIFESVDLDFVRSRRVGNFRILHEVLAATSRLSIPSIDSFECPLVYPYWFDNGSELKKKLIGQGVFVATYWPNVFEWAASADLEYELANNVVCIPIDQRYGVEEMKFIIKEIEKCC